MFLTLHLCKLLTRKGDYDSKYFLLMWFKDFEEHSAMKIIMYMFLLLILVSFVYHPYVVLFL